MLWQNTSMTQSEEILEQGLINIVLHEGDKCLMVLRPYQFYAVEQILDCVQNTNKNVYIWHTTGAGKTLTSFKAAQLVRLMVSVKQKNVDVMHNAHILFWSFILSHSHQAAASAMTVVRNTFLIYVMFRLLVIQ